MDWEAISFSLPASEPSVATQIGGVALAIDAKDDRAANWYKRFGASRLLDDPLKLVLPLGTITEAIAVAERKGK